MPEEHKIPSKTITPKKFSIKELKEKKERRQTIEDCVTMVMFLITRGSYLVQLDQIRTMFIEHDSIKTTLDTIIIEEIEEIIEETGTLVSNCEIANLIDQDSLNELLDDLGNLDTDKAMEYGMSTWKLFSKVIIDYVLGTCKY